MSNRLTPNTGNQRGFTIVELMIATAVFSIVLLILTTGVLSFTRQYYKGIINNRTQNIARNTVREITQSIQFSTGEVTTLYNNAGQVGGYCINGRPYYFALGRQLNGGDAATTAKHVLITGSANCVSPAPNITNADLNSSPYIGFRELLGDKMRLAYFNVTPISGGSTEVVMRIAYGDKDLLCSGSVANSCQPTGSLTDTQILNPLGDNALQCRGSSGNQFCSVIGFTTQVVKRVQ